MIDEKLEITNLITPIINSFKALNSEWKNFFEIGISDYLQSQTEKYYYTNTFIHRSEKVKFHEIYYPIKATYKKLTTDFSNLNDILDEYKNITLVGSAGSGKTTLIKHIFLNSIKSFKKIPILIELRNVNEYNGSFEKLITEKILESRVKPNDATFKRTLKSGNFLFLLDGYDEIFSTKKQEINRQIELFIDSYSENRFLITTRPGSGIESFPRFYDFLVCSLSNDDVIGFISKIVEVKERKERIIDIVKDPKNKNYVEYLRNPLLLSMFIMAFESHPEIPTRKSAFYRNVYDTLYSRHDGITKNSFPREKMTKLERDDFEKILCVFSYLSLLEGRYTFTTEYLTDTLLKVKKLIDFNFKIEDLIYDLRTSISIIILDGFQYNFPHRSMQEYFTALFMSKLPTDRKFQAYKNLSKILEHSSIDNSFNFWSLCKELDNTIFISNFLIPQLKIFLEVLKEDDDMNLLNAFFKLVGAQIMITESDKGNIKEIGIYRHSNFYNSIIQFCEIYNYEDFWKFPKKSGAEKEMLEMHFKTLSNLKKDGRKVVQLQINQKMKFILLKYKIADLIKKFKNDISNKVLKWEIEIKKSNDNIDELLKF